jgi:hypothetical protein
MHRSRLLLLVVAALTLLSTAAHTPALTQTEEEATNAPPKNLAARKALCKQDCSPNGQHGINRAYGIYKLPEVEAVTFDSQKGKEMYAQCIANCLGPLPFFYLQRPFLEASGHVFGKTAASCLDCHSKGPNLPVR